MQIVARAKVTLSLRVLRARADGYHELEALVVTVDEPHDVLEFDDSRRTSLSVIGPFASSVPNDDTNLVVRALRMVDQTAAVRLHKRIPPGAGLGGGSADAAAALRAFGGTPADAAALGSDVPFCFAGGAAWMRGRGEALERLTGLPPLDVVIVAPEFGCSTPAVYRAWDELGAPRSQHPVEAPAGYPGPFVNDLEPAAEHVEPALRGFRDRMEEVVQRPALLCGSGSAYAAWFDDPDACDTAAQRARQVFGELRAWRARTLED